MMESGEGAAAAVLAGEWLTLEETVTALGKSASTIERLVAQERLRSKLEPRAGRKPERLYSAADVQKLKAAGATGSSRKELVPVRAPRPPAALTIAPEFTMAAREIAELLRAPRLLGPQEKLWLTVDEAAEISGLRPSYLRDSCVDPEYYQEGRNLIGVRGGPHGALRIQRASLDAFAG